MLCVLRFPVLGSLFLRYPGPVFIVSHVYSTMYLNIHQPSVCMVMCRKLASTHICTLWVALNKKGKETHIQGSYMVGLNRAIGTGLAVLAAIGPIFGQPTCTKMRHEFQRVLLQEYASRFSKDTCHPYDFCCRLEASTLCCLKKVHIKASKATVNCSHILWICIPLWRQRQ